MSIASLNVNVFPAFPDWGSGSGLRCSGTAALTSVQRKEEPCSPCHLQRRRHHPLLSISWGPLPALKGGPACMKKC